MPVLPGWKAAVNKRYPRLVRISVNRGERAVEVEAGRPLLFGLMSGGIYIPSACGGRGSCGQCRVRIPGGTPRPNETEVSLLSQNDRSSGVRLACQVRVGADLSIEIPARHFAARQHPARVARLRDLTWEIKEVTLDLEGPQDFSFIAGQYVQVFLPGSESSSEPLYRAYSMASSPSSPRRLVFIVRRDPAGVVSPYLCDRLREGDTLAIRGPFGDFRMHESNREILFVAGGSGLAPIRSMLLSMTERQALSGSVPRAATLFFSVRSAKDLFHGEELKLMEGSLAGFRFVPAFSNPGPGEPWDGEKGGITAVLNRRFSALSDHDAYLCGSAGMIDAAVRVLTAKGLPQERIFFDKFL